MKLTLRESCGDGIGPNGSALANTLHGNAIMATRIMAPPLPLEVTGKLQIRDVESRRIGEDQALVVRGRAQGELERRDHARALGLALARGLLDRRELHHGAVLEDRDAADLDAARVAWIGAQARYRPFALDIGIELRNRLAARELLARHFEIGFRGEPMSRAGPGDVAADEVLEIVLRRLEVGRGDGSGAQGPV